MAGIMIGAAIAGGAALAGAGISAYEGNKAAKAQSQAAQSAAQLQYQASQDALNFQKQQYGTSQQQMQPWLQSGQGALANLNYLMGIGGQPQAVQGQMGSAGGGLGGARAVGPQPYGGLQGMPNAQMAGSANPVSTGMQQVGTGYWGGPNGSASPVSAGMNGIPGGAGMPANTGPVSAGMGGVPSRLDALRAVRSAGIPGAATPVNAGMAGVPAGGGRLQGIGAVNAGAIPAGASPVSAGLNGVPGGIPGTASPVSAGIGGVGGGIPGAYTGPISAGMGGVPSGGNQLQGIGSVRAGMPASTSPVSTGLGVSNPGIPVSGSQPPSTGMGGDTGYQPNQANGGYGSLMQPWTQQFQAPTNLTEQLDPGYQARLALGTDALQRSAAARGNLLTGGTAKALDTYAQDYASNEYGNVYNRAFNQYAQNYNQFQNNQANQYNRLASLAGVGQTAAGQLSMAGQNASNNVSNNLLSTAQGMGQQYNNAAAANASGMVGGANAWSGALGGAGNNISNLMMLKQMGAFGSGGGLPGTSTLGSFGYGAMNFSPALGDTTNYNNWSMS